MADLSAPALDWDLIELAAELASRVYETDLTLLANSFEELGIEFRGRWQNNAADFCLGRSRNDGTEWIVNQGTRVSEGFSLSELLADANPDNLDFGHGAKVPSAIYLPLQQLIAKNLIIDLIDQEKRVIATGHSLGGWHSLFIPVFAPEATVVALAPPEAGNEQFWELVYGGRQPPVLIGREDDFAPGWNKFNSHSCQYPWLVHLVKGEWEWEKAWPWDDLSIPAHSVSSYLEDIKNIASKERNRK